MPRGGGPQRPCPRGAAGLQPPPRGGWAPRAPTPATQGREILPAPAEDASHGAEESVSHRFPFAAPFPGTARRSDLQHNSRVRKNYFCRTDKKHGMSDEDFQASFYFSSDTCVVEILLPMSSHCACNHCHQRQSTTSMWA